MHLSIDVLLLILTVLLGAALSRVSLCAVAAVQQCVVARDFSGVQRLLGAASAAGIVLLACSAWAPMRLGLPGALPVANARAVHFGLMIGLALSCELAPLSLIHI